MLITVGGLRTLIRESWFSRKKPAPTPQTFDAWVGSICRMIGLPLSSAKQVFHDYSNLLFSAKDAYAEGSSVQSWLRTVEGEAFEQALGRIRGKDLEADEVERSKYRSKHASDKSSTEKSALEKALEPGSAWHQTFRGGGGGFGGGGASGGW